MLSVSVVTTYRFIIPSRDELLCHETRVQKAPLAHSPRRIATATVSAVNSWMTTKQALLLLFLVLSTTQHYVFVEGKAPHASNSIDFHIHKRFVQL